MEDFFTKTEYPSRATCAKAVASIRSAPGTSDYKNQNLQKCPIYFKTTLAIKTFHIKIDKLMMIDMMIAKGIAE